jgi:tRNA threonylcarbamoyl adenosine modification protein YeaZ
MISEPIILAVETALGAGSLSLVRGLRKIASHRGEKSSRAEDLLPLASAMLKENNLSLREVDLIAVSTGPGSFTGIRIGVSTAQALALGANRPLFGISTLEALAYSAGSFPVIAVVRTRKNFFIWQRFEQFAGGEQKFKPQVAAAEEILNLIGSSTSQDIKVVLESNARKRLIEVDSQVFENQRQRFIFASDNVAGLIAEYSFYLFKNGASHKPFSLEYFLDSSTQI